MTHQNTGLNNGSLTLVLTVHSVLDTPESLSNIVLYVTVEFPIRLKHQ